MVVETTEPTITLTNLNVPSGERGVFNIQAGERLIPRAPLVLIDPTREFISINNITSRFTKIPSNVETLTVTFKPTSIVINGEEYSISEEDLNVPDNIVLYNLGLSEVTFRI